MPITIPEGLPAIGTLENENVFVMTKNRAMHQDIRPLNIGIVNLMPTKIVTETQLIRLLSNSPLQIELVLIKMSSHKSRNVSEEHMESFYKNFSDIKDKKLDGLIITGAPVENLDFEDVTYWDELCEIMEWSKTHVFSTFHICWAAQAGLFYHYDVPKYPLSKKMFGVFPHKVLKSKYPLVRGFDEIFYAPHSRHTEIKKIDIENHPDLEIVAESELAGVYMVAEKSGRMIFVTGHSEYDFDTLAKEYFRDVEKGLDIDVPYNYFPDNNPDNAPVNFWRGHAHLLFSNWLNYHVYQKTPYNPDEI